MGWDGRLSPFDGLLRAPYGANNWPLCKDKILNPAKYKLLKLPAYAYPPKQMRPRICKLLENFEIPLCCGRFKVCVLCA